MHSKLQKLSVPIGLSAGGMLLLWGIYEAFRGQPASAVVASPNQPAIRSTGPASGYIQYYPQNALAASLLATTPVPYAIGMDREEIRRAPGTQGWFVATVLRPDKGWHALPEDTYGVGGPAGDFESRNAGRRVASCEVYRGGDGFHILFFDAMGTLIGFERTPDGILYYSGCAKPATGLSQ